MNFKLKPIERGWLLNTVLKSPKLAEPTEAVPNPLPTPLNVPAVKTFIELARFLGKKNEKVGIEAFAQELSQYKGGKGSVQFPLDQPIPFGLISKIVKFRVKENLARATAKEKKHA